MALKSRQNFKTQLGNTDLTLEAKTGESFLVKDIRIFYPLTSYATVHIDRATVGYFRVGGGLGSHLHFPFGRADHSHDIKTGTVAAAAIGNGAIMTDAAGADETTISLGDTTAAQTYARRLQTAKPGQVGKKTILGYLWDKGIFKGFPVAPGETFTITGVKKALGIQQVEYDIYDEGDMKPEMENGSKSSVRMYINYGGTGAVIAAAGDTVLDTPANPAEFVDFPYGKDVPAKTAIELYGIIASDVAAAANDDTDAICTQYLKMIHETNFLFDEDRNGLLYYNVLVNSLGGMDFVGEGYSIGGNYSDIDVREPHMFEEPLVFNEGEELSVIWNTYIKGAGQDLTEALQEIGLILKIRPAG